MELKGKVAVVTGAAVRLGRALALALVEQGVQVAVHYGSSAGAAQKTVAQAESMGGCAVAIQADLSQTGQLPALLKQVVDQFGQVDILVNNAAVFEPGDVAHTTEEAWDRHFAVNLKAPFFLSQAFAAHVGPEQRGHIINIADWRGSRPGVDYIAYTLTKAALIAMTQNLALGLAPHIQVNAIAPGAILPPPGQDQFYLDRLAMTIPARRAGSPDEVARAMIFLLKSDFVTGNVVYVTGGQHL